jgi:hypothetical protein
MLICPRVVHYLQRNTKFLHTSLYICTSVCTERPKQRLTPTNDGNDGTPLLIKLKVVRRLVYALAIVERLRAGDVPRHSAHTTKSHALAASRR